MKLAKTGMQHNTGRNAFYSRNQGLWVQHTLVFMNWEKLFAPASSKPPPLTPPKKNPQEKKEKKLVAV